MDVKKMSDEVLVARLMIVANSVSIIGESNELSELSSEVLSRMSNVVANNQFDLTPAKPSQVN